MSAAGHREALEEGDEAPPSGERLVRTFTLREDLYRAFVGRAAELECSVEWLLTEAMKRVLEERMHDPRATKDPTRVPAGRAAPPARREAPAPPPLALPRKHRPAPAEASIVLRVATADGERRVMALHGAVIGRNARDADVVLQDVSVSRRHAMLEHTADGWCISDLGSTNGVYVNGARMVHAVLRPGDTIVIGSFPMKVVEA
jgi:hypothetical protein